jgi:GNAT superfamily N-acetyltransferase
VQRLVVRQAAPADQWAIEAVSSRALEALAASPSVSQWGRSMRQDFVSHHVAAPNRLSTVVAELESTTVGVGSVSRGRRHPHDLLRIEVSPEWRRKGVGSALYERLVEREPGPFVVREMLSDHESVDFYTNRGFVTGEVATEGLIDPSSGDTSRWLDRELATARDVNIVPILGSGFEERDIGRAVDDLYVWTHPHSPPQAASDEAAIAQYLRAWHRECGFVAVRGGETIGVGLVHESPFRKDPRLAHLVWCGVRDPNESDAAAVTEALLAECLGVARIRGWCIEVEVNHPHEYLVDAVERVPGAKLFRDLTMLVSRYGG